MQSFHPILLTLLTVSHVALAEPQADSSAATGPSAPRIHLAQAQPPDSRAKKPEEKANRESDREQRRSERAPTDEEALALAALEGLMAQPDDRALPIVKKVLSGKQSTLVKRRALFVLSQIESPEAQKLLVDTAKSPDAELRMEAIRNIGIGGDPASLAVLQEIYNNGDRATKKRVLEAWLISDSKEEVFKAASNAKSDADTDDAIRILGAMGASEELRKLGEMKKPGRGLLEAYAISGDLASLRKIAEGDSDLDTRREAVRKIGIIDGEPSRVALREIYSKAKEPDIKRAALDGMLISGDEQGVLTLYRNAQSADDKRELLRTLSHMDGDAALEAIDAALEGKK